MNLSKIKIKKLNLNKKVDRAKLLLPPTVIWICCAIYLYCAFAFKFQILRFIPSLTIISGFLIAVFGFYILFHDGRNQSKDLDSQTKRFNDLTKK